MLKTERKKTLTKALDILSQNIKVPTDLDSLLKAAKPLGRRRDSNLYLVNIKTDAYPDGILIKIASNQKRISRWDPLEEAIRLNKLSTAGPRAKNFYYLDVIYASENPHFIALPYFPSSSLRTMLESNKKHSPEKASSSKINDSFYSTGKWLGMLYSLSPKKTVNSSSMHSRGFVLDRISELEKYSGVTEINKLSSYIDSLYVGQQKALEIDGSIRVSQRIFL